MFRQFFYTLFPLLTKSLMIKRKCDATWLNALRSVRSHLSRDMMKPALNINDQKWPFTGSQEGHSESNKKTAKW